MAGFFRQLPTADFFYTAEETNALYERVRSGDEQAAQLMITGNIRQVVQCVKKYRYLQDTVKNELVQVALYVLVRCVRKVGLGSLDGKDTKNPYGYIRRSVKRQLITALDGDRLRSSGPTHRRRMRLNGQETPAITIGDVAKLRNKTPDAIGYVDLVECVNLALKTEQDRKIFEFLCEGHDQTSIGVLLGLTRARISQIISGIRKRLTEVME